MIEPRLTPFLVLQGENLIGRGRATFYLLHSENAFLPKVSRPYPGQVHRPCIPSLCIFNGPLSYARTLLS
jgi:hypothetical protein